jgi:hypothetical protein
MFSFNSCLKSCCVLLTIALVSIGATSKASAAPQTDRVQVLINETSAQFQLAFRLHPAEGQQRQEQLNAAVAAWRAAPRTPANNELFAAWLRSAIRSSMPGARAAMPPLPSFKSSEPVVVKRPVETKPVEVKRPVSVTPVETKRPTAVAPVEVRSEEPFRIEDYAVEPPLVVPSSTTPEAKTDPFRDDPVGEQKK